MRPLSAASLSFLAVAACGGDGGPTGDDGTTPRVVFTSEPTSVATGDSVALSAQLRGANDRPLPGVVTFAALTGSVARVGGAFVHGLRPGATLVVASSAGATPDTVTMAVVERLTALDVVPESVPLRNVDDSATVAVAAYAGLAPFTGPLTWIVRDPEIATVSGTGVVRARRNGTTFVLAQGGALRDSTRVTVATPLVIGNDSRIYGAGLEAPHDSVMLQYAASAPVRVRFLSSAPDVVANDSVLIPAGARAAYFRPIPLQVGDAVIVVAADGYRPDTLLASVRAPRFLPQNAMMLNSAADRQLRPSLGIPLTAGAVMPSAPLAARTVSLSSSDPTVATVAPTAELPAASEGISGPGARVSAYAPGRAWIRFSLAGVPTDSVEVVVRRVHVQGPATFYVGLGQQDGIPLASPDDNRARPIDARAFAGRPDRVIVADSVHLAPAGNFLGFVRIREAIGLGIDTIRLVSPFTDTLKIAIVVTAPRLAVPPLLPTVARGTVFFENATTTDSLGQPHAPATTVVFRVESSDTTVLRVSEPTVRALPANALTTLLQITAVGPGTAYLTYTDEAGRYPPARTPTVTVLAGSN